MFLLGMDDTTRFLHEYEPRADNFVALDDADGFGDEGSQSGYPAEQDYKYQEHSESPAYMLNLVSYPLEEEDDEYLFEEDDELEEHITIREHVVDGDWVQFHVQDIEAGYEQLKQAFGNLNLSVIAEFDDDSYSDEEDSSTSETAIMPSAIAPTDVVDKIVGPKLVYSGLFCLVDFFPGEKNKTSFSPHAYSIAIISPPK